MTNIYRLTENPDLVLLVNGNLQTAIYNNSQYPDYQEKWNVYADWLAAGGIPEPYKPPIDSVPLNLAERLKLMQIDLAELKALLN